MAVRFKRQGMLREIWEGMNISHGQWLRNYGCFGNSRPICQRFSGRLSDFKHSFQVHCAAESPCYHMFSVSDETPFAPKYFHWLQFVLPFDLSGAHWRTPSFSGTWDIHWDKKIQNQSLSTQEAFDQEKYHRIRETAEYIPFRHTVLERFK